MARKLRHIILGIFDKRQHNRQYMRLVYKYLPGKVFGEWTDSYKTIQYGHLYIVKYLHQFTPYYNKYITKNNTILNKIRKYKCDIKIYFQKLYEGEIHYNDNNWEHDTIYWADIAAYYGHVHILQYLAQFEIYCSRYGYDNALKNRHYHVLEHIRTSYIIVPKNWTRKGKNVSI